jgi:hypothetical protein
MTSTNGIANPAALDGQIDEVVRSAQRELVHLLEQRAEVMKRIGTVKQTLVHMARLFGENVLTAEVLPLLGRTQSRKQPGLTRACRTVLMEAASPLEARQGLRELQRRFPGMIDHHKIPLASVTTVFNRLVASGEVRSLSNTRGRRVWEWSTVNNKDDMAITVPHSRDVGRGPSDEPVTEQ